MTLCGAIFLTGGSGDEDELSIFVCVVRSLGRCLH